MHDLPFDPSAISRKDMTGAGLGAFAEVGHIKRTNLVIKMSPPDDKRQTSEKRIHEHLLAQNKQHPNILKYMVRFLLNTRYSEEHWC
jgi:hypothetical protein